MTVYILKDYCQVNGIKILILKNQTTIKKKILKYQENIKIIKIHKLS